MKKTILSLCAAFIAVSSFAQDADRIYKPFKVDVTTGVSILQGSGTNIGFLFAVEPKYAVLEQLSVGIRWEGLMGLHNISSNADNSSESDVTFGSSYIATADYYLNNNTFRPYVGVGLGMYKTSKVTYKGTDDNTYDFNVPKPTTVGGMVRAGFEVTHFRMGLEYNYVNNTFTSPYSNKDIKSGYFSIKVGVHIGGGKY
jgi:outer membrane protein X